MSTNLLQRCYNCVYGEQKEDPEAYILAYSLPRLMKSVKAVLLKPFSFIILRNNDFEKTFFFSLYSSLIHLFFQAAISFLPYNSAKLCISVPLLARHNILLSFYVFFFPSPKKKTVVLLAYSANFVAYNTHFVQFNNHNLFEKRLHYLFKLMYLM